MRYISPVSSASPGPLLKELCRPAGRLRSRSGIFEHSYPRPAASHSHGSSGPIEVFFEFPQRFEGCIGGLVVISAQLLRRLIAHLPVNEADVSSFSSIATFVQILGALQRFKARLCSKRGTARMRLMMCSKRLFFSAYSNTKGE